MDICKAFDQAWHEDLVYKLQSLEISCLPLKCIESFLSNRLQRVLLNGQSSSWSPVPAGMPQRSILGPLLFLVLLMIYLKIYHQLPGDTSIFSVGHDISVLLLQLNDDLIKISNCAYQWKMSFNPAVTKQAQEVFFSHKSQKVTHSTVLDEKLDFIHHIKENIFKANKGVSVIKKLNNIVPRKALLTLL